MQKKFYKYKIFKNCRLCNSHNINVVNDFNPMPIGNDLKKNINDSIKSKKYPLKLMQCNNCNHFQLSISINPEILFAKNYSYLTGITNTFNKHFDKYSQWIIKKCKLKKNSLILDIGSNDGTCLSYFKKKQMKVLGIDPAKVAASLANKNKIKTLNNFFNEQTAELILNHYGEVDFITSHNVLAHTENIQEIFKSAFRILKINGYFCFEIGYFKDVIKKNFFDTIYHEHLDYHHATPLVKFLENIGFSIVNLSTNTIQGGTLRVLLRKRKKLAKKTLQVNKFIEKERVFFKQINIFEQFMNFNRSMLQLKQIVSTLKDNHIMAYGSPTKASLLLISSKLNKKIIKNTFEDNLLKCGKFIPGTDIKILSTFKLKKMKPKNIIILAWNFSTEIKQKLKNLKIKNINLIIPLPKPIIVKI